MSNVLNLSDYRIMRALREQGTGRVAEQTRTLTNLTRQDRDVQESDIKGRNRDIKPSLTGINRNRQEQPHLTGTSPEGRNPEPVLAEGRNRHPAWLKIQRREKPISPESEEELQSLLQQYYELD